MAERLSIIVSAFTLVNNDAALAAEETLSG